MSSSEERATLMLADRLAGLTYEVISKKHQVSPKTAQRYCVMAMRRGEVTPEQIQFRSYRKSAQFGTDEAYHRYWLARVKRKIVLSEQGCWIWQGNHTPTGYGQTAYRGKANNVHRLMYQVHYGVKLQTDEYVLHRCDVRGCCNPEHLWIGTAKDNNNDCAGKGRHYEGARTHCERGHEFSPENTIVRKQAYKDGIKRVCRACERIRYRMALGWTEEEAATLPKVRPGYTRESVR